jgi:hypothetical protein
MQMEVLVGIDMIEREAGRGKGRELGLDLGGKLAPHRRLQGNVKAHPRHIRPELPIGADEARDALRRQGRPAFDQHQVKADPKPRHGPCPRHGIGRGRRRDHQAGGRQHAFAVGLFDGVVDRVREAEIVGGDD